MEIIANLRKEKYWVLVPSNKTSTWVLTETNNYIKWMNEHLNEKCKEVKNPELTATYKTANELLDKFESMMSDSEVKYMQCWIRSRRIPTPQLLIKDHKSPKEDGTYPTRLLILATCLPRADSSAVPS